MIVTGPPRAVVLECNRRCGSRFVREAWEGERDRGACARAVWDANAAGWREMKGRGLRCAGCFERYGEGEKFMHTSLHDALAALFDCAPKCDVCEDHAATRGDDDTRLCDRETCNTVEACAACGSRDAVGPVEHLRCALCGATGARREPLVAAPVDRDHADSLRAANAAHEARR